MPKVTQLARGWVQCRTLVFRLQFSALAATPLHWPLRSSAQELGYSDAQTDGKILKSDTIRPSSAKTASKEMASKEKAEKAKDDEYIDDKSKKIANAINTILPSYCKIEPSKRALLLAEIEKIIKKEFR